MVPATMRYTYMFGHGHSEGNAGMGRILGERGAALCELANLGLAVVPGFCVPNLCDLTRTRAAESRKAVAGAVLRLEETSLGTVGGTCRPLLLSVQSGHRLGSGVSNIGLNDEAVEKWSAFMGPHFVWDSYRRLIEAYGVAVKGMDRQDFAKERAALRSELDRRCGLGRRHEDCHIPTTSLQELVQRYKAAYWERCGEEFPQDPDAQLWGALRAVMEHQNGKGSAGIVQAMAFGNYDFLSASGVALWDSATQWDDESEAFRGSWAPNAQVEDLLEGRRLPRCLTMDLSQALARSQGHSESQRADECPSLEEENAAAFSRLVEAQMIVAGHGLRDVRGVLFNIEQGQIFFCGTVGHADVLAIEAHRQESAELQESLGELEFVIKDTFIKAVAKTSGTPSRRSASSPPAINREKKEVQRVVVCPATLRSMRMPGSLGCSIVDAGTEATCSNDADEDDGRVTLMIRHSQFSRKDCFGFLQQLNLQDKLSFMYLPVNFTTGLHLGDAILSFESTADARRFQRNFREMYVGLEISWNEVQGLGELVERYRNRAVMHPSVPEEYKPMLFREGSQVQFPKPTTKVRPPRLRPTSVMKSDRN